jgi:membrane-bound serine protease (ClpP class)
MLSTPTRPEAPQAPKPIRWHRLILGVSLLLLGLLGVATPSTALPLAESVAGASLPAVPPSVSPAPSSASAPVATPTAVPASRQMTNAAVISIHGEITAVTAVSFERRVKAALDGGADGIIVHLDTPGGEVGAVLEITKTIKGLSVPTLAWVNAEAYSGGAIIAIACQSIVASRNAVMGNAAPIAFDPLAMMMGRIRELSPSERNKILSPLLTEVVDSARRNGHDEILVQSFLMLGVETWMVEDTQTGRVHFLTRSEYVSLFGEQPPASLPPLMPSAAIDVNTPSRPMIDPAEPAPDPPAGSPVEPAAEGPADAGTPARQPIEHDAPFRPGADLPPDLVNSVSLSLNVRSTRPDFARADPSRYRLVRYATDGRSLLTLPASDLQEVRLADPTQYVNTHEELARYVGATNVRVLDQSWSESVVEFMTQGFSGLVIRGGLIVVFLLCLFIELVIPGIGVAGVIALLALAGLIIPPLLLNAAIWWTIAAILVGVVLILLEIFVFPGFGAPGAIGVVLVLVGLVGTFASAGELFPGSNAASGSSLMVSAAVVLLALFGAIVGMYLFTRYTKIVPFANTLVLTDTARTPASPTDPSASATPQSALRVGDVGTTTTPLRPSGTAEFNDALYDVVAGFGLIEPGTPVRVVEVSGHRIVVEADGSAAETPPAGTPTTPASAVDRPGTDPGDPPSDEYTPISFT